MKIENMSLEQLNACFSLLGNIIEHLPVFGDDASDVWKYIIGLEKQVGAELNVRIDEMFSDNITEGWE